MSMSYLIFVVTVVVAICAILAAYGFKGRSTTIGVDLGTTFSVVGVVKNGKVTIVEDEQGRNIFPSIISFANNGEIYGLYDAMPYLSTNPANTIFNAKRFIGKRFDEEDVEDYASAHPFKVVEINSTKYGNIGFEISSSGHPKEVSPVEIGTHVLKHLLKVTAGFLGHAQVNKAVIAVPAKFSAIQREATAMAYKAAGLKVVRVLEEPTAAAVAYDLHKNSSIHHILVYDFGGGTLDVSLLFVANGSVQVYATDGDDTLGGSDFDLCMYDIVRQKLESHHEITLEKLSEMQRETLSSEFCTSATVRAMAEQIKKDLTYVPSKEFKCQFPSGKHVSFDITKDEFEHGCKDLFDRGLLPVTRLLDDLGN